MLTSEEVLKILQHRRRRSVKGLIKRHHNPLQQLFSSLWRVRYQANVHRSWIELSQKVTEKGRFSRTHFSGNYGEPSAIHHAKFKHRKGHAVNSAPIDQVRIRQY